MLRLTCVQIFRVTVPMLFAPCAGEMAQNAVGYQQLSNSHGYQEPCGCHEYKNKSLILPPQNISYEKSKNNYPLMRIVMTPQASNYHKITNLNTPCLEAAWCLNA